MDLKTLGQRIRQAREVRGWSQEELATLIGKDQTAISEYETGKRKISVTELPHLAQVLHVPVAYFFGQPAPDDSLGEALLIHFRQLPESAKHDVLEIMRLLAKLLKPTH